MKTFFLALLIGIAGHLLPQQVVKYQPLTVVSVHNPMTPLPILDHFARNYPGVTPHWGMQGRHYVAVYIDPEKALRHMVIYDKHGTILRREDELHLEDCPIGLQAYYFKNYPNEELRVWSYEEAGDVKYYFRHRSRTLWFDKDGNHIRKGILWL